MSSGHPFVFFCARIGNPGYKRRDPISRMEWLNTYESINSNIVVRKIAYFSNCIIPRQYGLPAFPSLCPIDCNDQALHAFEHLVGVLARGWHLFNCSVDQGSHPACHVAGSHSRSWNHSRGVRTMSTNLWPLTCKAFSELICKKIDFSTQLILTETVLTGDKQ